MRRRKDESCPGTCRIALETRPAVPSSRLSHLTAAVVRRGIDLEGMRAEQGQTLVEFALILPILLLLVIGLFDFGSAFNTKNDLNFLANTAARYGEVNSCAPCSPGQSIDRLCEGHGRHEPARPERHASRSACRTAPAQRVGDPLRVSATGQFPWAGRSETTGALNFGNATLTSTVTVRILASPTDPPFGSVPSACP